VGEYLQQIMWSKTEPKTDLKKFLNH